MKKSLSIISAIAMMACLAPVSAMADTAGGITLNLGVNQMNVLLSDGEMRYFNTADVESVEFDGNKMTINSSAAAPVVYDGNVTSVSFRKADGSGPVIVNPEGKVSIKEAKGWLEAAYVKFDLFTGANGYNVYYRGGKATDWTAIDGMLVRNYGTYGRADLLGLTPGSYDLMVVPTSDGTEIESAANTVEGLDVTAHDRSGFAHKDFTGGVGAYNNYGSLKSGA